MCAAPAHKVLTPDDLLALVRKSPQQFQKSSPVDTPSDTAAQEFVAQSPVRRVEELPAHAPAPLPEPQNMAAPEKDETPVPDAANPEAEESGAGESGSQAENFSPAAPPQVIDMETERQAAWDAGFAQAMQEIEAARLQARDEALAQARAEAEETLEEVRTAFEAALARLNSAEQEVATTLTTHLETAVRILASDRAGQKIDDTPQPFLRRIEKMAREIAAGAESLVVQMNPADLMAIKPHIKSFSPLSQARLSPDPKLGRGDLHLKMDAVTFSDVIADRQAGGLR